MTDDNAISNAIPANSSFELASRNTGLAIQRTRLSADRTLMAVIRTSLSLLGFGFTITQIFRNLTESGVFKGSAAAGPRFGVALTVVSTLMLIIGIIYHMQFMLALRTARKGLIQDGLIRGASPFPYSFTLVTAVVLLGISLTAIASMLFHVGPFD